MQLRMVAFCSCNVFLYSDGSGIKLGAQIQLGVTVKPTGIGCYRMNIVFSCTRLRSLYRPKKAKVFMIHLNLLSKLEKNNNKCAPNCCSTTARKNEA